MTFFASFDRIRWVDAAPDDRPDDLAERVLRALSA
jgi:hypothetical protein